MENEELEAYYADAEEVVRDETACSLENPESCESCQ